MDARGRLYTLGQAMDDDFNTPNALSVLFEMAREINKLKTEDTEKALMVLLLVYVN